MSVRYQINNDGSFIVHDYNRAAPFSNMFPGVAGVWGTPMWLFWVNRGQCVACFGTRDKDRAIMEFQSANLHYRRTPLEGFRTFLRGVSREAPFCYEPFRLINPRYETANHLVQTAGSLIIVEENKTLGIRTKVHYFTIPNEPFAALARITSITNTGQRHLEMLCMDGMSSVVPYGINHCNLKMMPFISDGYLRIKNLEDRAPFFTVGNVPGDESETAFVDAGNFYFAFSFEGGAANFAQVIVDPAVVFGEYNDRIEPYAFFGAERFVYPAEQNTVCQTPCAYSYRKMRLAPGDTEDLYAIAGCAHSVEQKLGIAARVKQPGYFLRKDAENRKLLDQTRDRFFMHGGNPVFDRFVQQSFLDNTLRGGLPLTLRAKDRSFIFHVFSRKHGDLERDYNSFVLEPTWFSSGVGNFRDVNQNRRNDVWFNTDVAETNVHYFFNLLQPDAFNPLLCEGVRFEIEDAAECEQVLVDCVDTGDRELVRRKLARPFTPGSLFEAIQRKRVRLTSSAEHFLERTLAVAVSVESATYGHGYWSDHWMYSLDQLESFGALYPDRIDALLLDDYRFTYWDTDIEVLPRDDKYVLNSRGAVRHLHSVRRNEAKSALIASRDRLAHRVRIEYGKGEIYYSNLLGKLLCLAANKMATVAPSGYGIEMDGGRPGWCDSVNGLPALFGAGLPEMWRLLALVRLIRNLMAKRADWVQKVPVELDQLIKAVASAARAYADDDEQIRDYRYWDAASTAKEQYRRDTAMGFAGNESRLSVSDIIEFCSVAESRLTASLERAYYPDSKLPVTYVTHEAVEYEALCTGDGGSQAPKVNENGLRCVRVKRFSSHFFAPFLEGAVYGIEQSDSIEEARAVWKSVRASSLYDRRLGMYKISAGLDSESSEQGRTGGWAAGWFEKESIFSHVEFKYLLRLLQKGLCEEFFDDMRVCLPPFFDPAVYGRSPIENTSFIVCSAHQRKRWHGRGMQPRLSGTNAEMVHMALVMCFGARPFRFSEGSLSLALEPILPSWIFTKHESSRSIERPDGGRMHMRFPEGSLSVLFLGKTVVTYINEQFLNTYGPAGAKVRNYRLIQGGDADKVVQAPALGDADARAVRDGKYEQVIVTLAG